MCLDATLGFKLLEEMDFQTKMEEAFQHVLFEAVLRHWQVVQPGGLEPAGCEAGSLADPGETILPHFSSRKCLW